MALLELCLRALERVLRGEPPLLGPSAEALLTLGARLGSVHALAHVCGGAVQPRKLGLHLAHAAIGATPLALELMVHFVSQRAHLLRQQAHTRALQLQAALQLVHRLRQLLSFARLLGDRRHRCPALRCRAVRCRTLRGGHVATHARRL